MKRFFFSLIALSAAAIGCTQSALLETPDQFGTEITFSPYTGRTPVTKATEIVGKKGLADAGGFYVYGFLNDDTTNPYMAERLVSSTNNGDTWTYTGNAVYWPDATSSSTLSFVAYSANAKNEDCLLTSSSTGFTFQVNEIVDEQVDLLATAYQSGYTVNTSGVTNGNLKLEFYHLLSRIGFKIKASTNKSAITINDLTFVGYMPTKGVLDFIKANTPATATAAQKKTPSLTATGDKSTTEYKYVKGNTVANTNKLTEVQRIAGTEGKYLMIMPHTVLDSDHYIEVKYTIGNSSQKTSRVELPIGFEFEAGKAYEFILEISNSSLQFTVEEDPWDNENHQEEIEPEVSGPDISHQITNGGMSLLLTGITNGGVATFRLTVNTDEYKDGYAPNKKETVDDHSVGIAYKKANDSAWSYIYTNESSNGDISELQIDNLSPDTDYECCLAYRYQLWKEEKKWLIVTYYDIVITQTWTDVALDNLTLSFKTPGAAPTPPTSPSVILNDLIYADITSTTAVISGEFKHGTLEGGIKEGIKEYGFCWMIGDESPTIFNDAYSLSNTDNNGMDNPGTFSHTIDKLIPNTLYSCSAYVVVNSGKVYYSSVHTFTTKPFVKDENNVDKPNDGTGGGWGSEGEANPENKTN